MGRSWAGVVGNLMASWYGVLDLDVRHMPQLSFVTALAVSDMIRPIVPDPGVLKIKWPNDILYDGQKLCGILVQTVTLSNGLGVVVGVGLNMATAPEIGTYATTALNPITQTVIDPKAWLEAFAPMFAARLNDWQTQGFEGVADEWLAQAYGRDRLCLIQEKDGSVPATILGLDSFGALRLKGLDGRLHTVINSPITYMDR